MQGKTAIVTGASSGLGKEFAVEIIEKYRELDEIWLIARRKERLEEIGQKYPEKKVRAVPLDLGKEESFLEFEKLLDENKPDIKILVSNAGTGARGKVEDNEQYTKENYCFFIPHH